MIDKILIIAFILLFGYGAFIFPEDYKKLKYDNLTFACKNCKKSPVFGLIGE